jgi:hypothetical protein
VLLEVLREPVKSSGRVHTTKSKLTLHKSTAFYTLSGIAVTPRVRGARTTRAGSHAAEVILSYTELRVVATLRPSVLGMSRFARDELDHGQRSLPDSTSIEAIIGVLDTKTSSVAGVQTCARRRQG